MTNENTSSSGSLVKRLALPLGPILATIFALALRAGGLELDDSLLAGVTLWCAVWWVTEPVPVPATSLIPLALLPTLGLLDHKSTANAYGDSLILLLMGGFMLSRAMECTGAHKKVAIAVVQGVARLGGHGGRSVILGFMIATAALSMWISNTATTLMMLPVALAVISGTSDRKFAIPLLLGIAYAANIGGIGTPIGTPPNIIFMGAFDKLGVRDGSYGFLEWMKAGVPVVVLFVPIAWWWLTRGLSGKETFDLPKGESWTPGQRRVLFMFAMAAGLWIFQKYPALPIGWFTAQGLEDGGGGWTGLLRLATGGVIDARGSGSATVAALVVVALFSFPDSRGGRLLDWAHARTIPWGVLLLFGGGIALAQAFKSTGLSEVIAGSLTGMRGIPIPVMVGLVCLLTTFLTEITSNTALTALMMPILGATAMAMGIDPVILMAPAAMSASCAFMLPVATAPNAAIYGTEDVPINRMMREGFVLNLIGVAIISTLAMFLVSKASEGVDASLVSPSSFILPSDSDPSS
ncbi:MAG: SLC13/DASS family transporter [Phycisphaera sp. TMED9]|nr:MAG: SLC13/DASS family transporter [Phycisphaera sp. TMED9]